MRWLRDDRFIIWVLAVAVLFGATFNGLIGQVNYDSFSPVQFITQFTVSFLGQILVIALLLQLSVKRPKLGAIFILILSVCLSMYTWGFSGYSESFVGQSYLIALCLIASISYAFSSILLFKTKPIE